MFKPASNTRSRMITRANSEYTVIAAVAFDTFEIFESCAKCAPRHAVRRKMRRRCSDVGDPARVVREWTYCERGY